jgi:uncharacterized Rmd1/YagE family protein
MFLIVMLLVTMLFVILFAIYFMLKNFTDVHQYRDGQVESRCPHCGKVLQTHDIHDKYVKKRMAFNNLIFIIIIVVAITVVLTIIYMFFGQTYMHMGQMGGW